MVMVVFIILLKLMMFDRCGGVVWLMIRFEWLKLLCSI